MKRPVVIVAWSVGSFFGWVALMSAAGAVIWHLATERQVAFPDWALKAFSLGLVFGGMILVPAITALLGMRGKLPGTQRGPRPVPRGFDVGSSGDAAAG